MASKMMMMIGMLLYLELEGLHCFKVSYVKQFRVERNPVSKLDKPDFCHGLGCPDFKVIDKTKNYEERLYGETHWVSTHLEGADYDAATTPMFMKLFEYIEGYNAKNETIAMTAPVLVSVVPGPGPTCSSNFTMSFFLVPSSDAPPMPTDKDVFTSSLPQQRVFVKSFGGFAYKSQWLKNAVALSKSLLDDKKKFQDNLFYTAGYDSPFKILGRHNEVWFVA